MGSYCHSLCGNADTDADLKVDNPPHTQQQKEKPEVGLRRSQDLSNSFKRQQFLPVVSRSGNHFDFRNMNGALKQLDVAQVCRLQALVRGFLQRRKYRT